MKNIEQLVRDRRSVRTYDGRNISDLDKERLLSWIESIENPFGIAVPFRLLDAKKQGLTCPVVTGTDHYIGACVERGPYAEVAFGYSFEMFVLYAQSLGMGTVWLGGTMDRGAFERAMQLSDRQMMPCVSALGYPAEKMSLRETMMRKGVKADSRAPFESLFFDRSFDTPLTQEKAGRLALPLEMVRLAPSAVNRQPWRAVVTEDAVHFYLKPSKLAVTTSAGNMQKVDMGIALCHFALAAQESSITLTFTLDAPSINTPADVEYIASYRLT